jgi:hypothetical protein
LPSFVVIELELLFEIVVSLSLLVRQDKQIKPDNTIMN